MPKHVLIAANPKSGAGPSGGRVAGLQSALTSAGFDCQIEFSLDALRQQCLHLEAAGELRAVVSAGGDGTAEALANLLPPHIPLLLFPLGTENLLAKYLGITGDVGQACDILQGDRRLALDVGCANGKLFLVMLSCGFDAEVVRHMHAIRKGHINRWSYARPIISSIRSYRFPQLGWSMDTLPSQVPEEDSVVITATDLDSSAELGAANPAQPAHQLVSWLFVFNVPRYAAALDFCPQADPTDGLLDICTFERPGLVSGMGYLAQIWLGRHQTMRGFAHTRCRRLEIPAPIDHNGQTLEVPFQIDGDPGGVLPLTIEVLPGRLLLLVPDTCA